MSVIIDTTFNIVLLTVETVYENFSSMHTRPTNAWTAVPMILSVVLAWGTAGRAELTFQTLVSFSGSKGVALGGVPEAKLLLGTDGNFYGTTLYGGSNDVGSLFKITTNGTLSTLFNFSTNTGTHPQAALVQGKDGNFYGTTSEGGDFQDGTAFRISPNGDFSNLVSFAAIFGETPSAVVQGRDGNLYGTTWAGGTNGFGHYGTVFKLTTDGALSTLYCFGSNIDTTGVGLDGQSPQAPLMLASDGAFYGTTTAGGTNGGFGTIFRITADGSFTSLVSFDGTNGSAPAGVLAEAPDGSLWGTTSGGGIGFNRISYSGNGTVFKMTKSGQLTLLHYFTGFPTDGATPEFGGLTLATDGAWYGTTFYGGTNGSGAVFRLTGDGGWAILYSFTRIDANTGTNGDGATPWTGLTQAPDGSLYGTSGYGGEYGIGAVFRISDSGFAQPLIETITRTHETTTLSWKPLPGRRYQLQTKADVEPRAWTDVGQVVLGTDATASASDQKGSSASRVYRLRLLP